MTDLDLEGFAATGVLRLEGAFTARDANRMRDVVWNELLHRYQIDRDDPTTWDRHPPTGLRSAKKSRAFAPILGPAGSAALDAVLGPGAWLPAKHFGNVLVTMPNSTDWRVPHKIWHSDFPPTLRRDPLPVVKIWALIDDVAAGGGGTPQLAGSHRAFAQYLDATRQLDYKRAKFGFLASHPWLKELSCDDGHSDRNERFMGACSDVDGVPMRVVECTGRAGDVYITHPWVFHTISSNATTRPRLMRSCAIWRTDAHVGPAALTSR